MSLKFYNTLTRKKEIFNSIKDKEAGIYSCGPTVYWYQHIGNLRTYIFSDILKRVLEYENYKVKHVMNITDVGHLTSDADEGEDKMEKAAVKEGKKAEDIANYYWGVFKDDFKKLNIIEPNIWTKATEHIDEQIYLIKTLEKKGYAYRTSDGIYFDTSKVEDYGKLAKLNIKGLQGGKRINLGDKKNKTDFALWKFSEKPGQRQQEWTSPWGIGFPGWHIECSAMSMEYLGKTFDIHTGGIDHIPIHHTNEIAQSESATGKKFVHYWMHGNFLTFKGEKVSKSKGGLFTISELEKKGFNALSYRYLCLTTHYRKPLNFSIENLESAENSYQRLKNIISGIRKTMGHRTLKGAVCNAPCFLDDPKLKTIKSLSHSKEYGFQFMDIKDSEELNRKYLEEFEEQIENDLDMPNALQVLWKLVRDENAKGKLQTIKKMDEIFGLDLFKETEIKIPEKILKMVKERETAREKKDWKQADILRKVIEEKGYSVSDAKNGSVVGKL
jgi:cysteinyl-tRNA synthetase